MATVSHNHEFGFDISRCELDFPEPERAFVLAYAIAPVKLNAFKEFYKRDVHKWLKERGVRHAQAILAENILVVLTTSEGNVPWILGPTAIPGLKEYLVSERPIDVSKLPTFPGK